MRLLRHIYEPTVDLIRRRCLDRSGVKKFVAVHVEDLARDLVVKNVWSRVADACSLAVRAGRVRR